MRGGDRELIERYAFLPQWLPLEPVAAVRRAAATIARHSDAAVPREDQLRGPAARTSCED